jgi:hypothetical protein
MLLSIKGFDMFTGKHIVNNLKCCEGTVKLYKSLSMLQESSKSKDTSWSRESLSGIKPTVLFEVQKALRRI